MDLTAIPTSYIKSVKWKVGVPPITLAGDSADSCCFRSTALIGTCSFVLDVVPPWWVLAGAARKIKGRRIPSGGLRLVSCFLYTRPLVADFSLSSVHH